MTAAQASWPSTTGNAATVGNEPMDPRLATWLEQHIAALYAEARKPVTDGDYAWWKVDALAREDVPELVQLVQHGVAGATAALEELGGAYREVMARMPGTDRTSARGQWAGMVRAAYEAVGEASGGLRSIVLDRDQVVALPPPEPLVEGVLIRATLAELYAPSNVGKTFVAQDMAACIGAGIDWQGHATHQGRVLYVIGEGVAGFPRRIVAWETHHGYQVEGVDFIPRAVNLFDPTAVAQLAEFAKAMGYELVIFDTFARCTVGADENSGKDMSRIVAHLDYIRETAGCGILLVHHTGKDATRGGRGHSALQGALDTELALTGDPALLHLKSSKQKDQAETEPITLALKPVADSLVVVSGAGGPLASALTKGALESLNVLVAIDVPGGVTFNEWLAAAEVARSSFGRHRAALLRLRRVVNVGTDARPRYRPASEVDGWD